MAMSFEPPSTTSEPSPFLRLPAEIRNQIYMHLVPSEKLHPLTNEMYYLPWTPLEQMRASCSPAVLRLNRKIYNEVIELWYGVTTYPFFLDRKSDFLNHEYLVDETCDFPASLKLVRSLVVITSPCKPLQQAQIDSPPTWTTHLANFLADSKCLENLTISLIVLMHPGIAITESEGTVHASLEKTLSPFRVIRGLSKVTTTFSMRTNLTLATLRSINTGWARPDKKANVRRWTRAYLDEFEADMLRN
jgi:hypothetical protein